MPVRVMDVVPVGMWRQSRNNLGAPTLFDDDGILTIEARDNATGAGSAASPPYFALFRNDVLFFLRGKGFVCKNFRNFAA